MVQVIKKAIRTGKVEVCTKSKAMRSTVLIMQIVPQKISLVPILISRRSRRETFCIRRRQEIPCSKMRLLARTTCTRNSLLVGISSISKSGNPSNCQTIRSTNYKVDLSWTNLKFNRNFLRCI